MSIEIPLFYGNLICFTPIDREKDPEIESHWTHDPEYMRMVSLAPARPLAPSGVKKKYEAIEKAAEEGKNSFYFAVRTVPREGVESRLAGFVLINWIEWNNGVGNVSLGIGDPKDRCHGYGTEALNMVLRYAFFELNLFRLTAIVPEYNQAALRLFHKAGFVEEVRQRQALSRDGRRWDLIHLGILRQEME